METMFSWFDSMFLDLAGFAWSIMSWTTATALSGNIFESLAGLTNSIYFLLGSEIMGSMLILILFIGLIRIMIYALRGKPDAGRHLVKFALLAGVFAALIMYNNPSYSKMSKGFQNGHTIPIKASPSCSAGHTSECAAPILLVLDGEKIFGGLIGNWSNAIAQSSASQQSGSSKPNMCEEYMTELNQAAAAGKYGETLALSDLWFSTTGLATARVDFGNTSYANNAWCHWFDYLSNANPEDSAILTARAAQAMTNSKTVQIPSVVDFQISSSGTTSPSNLNPFNGHGPSLLQTLIHGTTNVPPDPYVIYVLNNGQKKPYGVGYTKSGLNNPKQYGNWLAVSPVFADAQRNAVMDAWGECTLPTSHPPNGISSAIRAQGNNVCRRFWNGGLGVGGGGTAHNNGSSHTYGVIWVPASSGNIVPAIERLPSQSGKRYGFGQGGGPDPFYFSPSPGTLSVVTNPTGDNAAVGNIHRYIHNADLENFLTHANGEVSAMGWMLSGSQMFFAWALLIMLAPWLIAAFVSALILAGGIILLPLVLLWAMFAEAGSGEQPKVLRTYFRVMISATLMGSLFSAMLAVGMLMLDLTQKFVSILPFSGTYWMAPFRYALVPLLVMFLLKRIPKHVGLGPITGMKSSLTAPLALAGTNILGGRKDPYAKQIGKHRRDTSDETPLWNKMAGRRLSDKAMRTRGRIRHPFKTTRNKYDDSIESGETIGRKGLLHRNPDKLSYRQRHQSRKNRAYAYGMSARAKSADRRNKLLNRKGFSEWENRKANGQAWIPIAGNANGGPMDEMQLKQFQAERKQQKWTGMGHRLAVQVERNKNGMATSARVVAVDMNGQVVHKFNIRPSVNRGAGTNERLIDIAARHPESSLFHADDISARGPNGKKSFAIKVKDKPVRVHERGASATPPPSP